MPELKQKITGKDLCSRFERVKTDRQGWDDYWQELAYYCLPHKAEITEKRAPGQKLPADVYDSTAINAAQIMAAGFHGYLTNPASEWFGIKMKDTPLNDEVEGKQWLSTSKKKINDTLNSSNFSEQIHEVYLDLSVFGTPCLYEEEDLQDTVRFFARDVGEIYISENERGRVDMVYRLFTLTARQAYEKWQGKAGKSVVDAYIKEKDYEKPFQFLHCVGPRTQRDPRKELNAKHKPFYSYFVAYKDKRIVSEGGYDEFPFFVTRFIKKSGKKYGYSPAMNALPDIKMLNRMSLTIIKAAQKVVDPPLVLPHDGFLLPLVTKPGGVNYRISGQAGDKIDTLQTNGNIPVGLEMEEQRRGAIMQTFFVDLFLMLRDRKNMTATEVLQRTEEKMLILGPVLGRLMTELLDPIIKRTFAILLRKGVIPPPPESLQGKEYVIEYVSPLAKAQKMLQSQSIQNFLVVIRGIAEISPEILAKINMDEVVDLLADFMGVDPSILNDEDKVEEIRKAQAEAQAQQMQLALAQTGAQTAKTVSEADRNFKAGQGKGR